MLMFQLITYYQPVCSFLKEYYNTLWILLTIPCEYYLQYPVNITYNTNTQIESFHYLSFKLSCKISIIILGTPKYPKLHILKSSGNLEQRNKRIHSAQDLKNFWYAVLSFFSLCRSEETSTRPRPITLGGAFIGQ